MVITENYAAQPGAGRPVGTLEPQPKIENESGNAWSDRAPRAPIEVKIDGAIGSLLQKQDSVRTTIARKAAAGDPWTQIAGHLNELALMEGNLLVLRLAQAAFMEGASQQVTVTFVSRQVEKVHAKQKHRSEARDEYLRGMQRGLEFIRKG